MSKKDYITFAKMFKHQRDIILSNPQDTNYKILESENRWYAHQTANIFEQDNPRFDREKFLKACGIS